jgi:hypothetical protein
MRFRNVAGLVDLPIYAIEHRYRNEPVLTVLPAPGAIPGRDAILVAMPMDLAVVIEDPGHRDGWITYLVPWKVVRLGKVGSDGGIHRLAIDIDGLVLRIELWGPNGARALGDFVVAAGATLEGLATTT